MQEIERFGILNNVSNAAYSYYSTVRITLQMTSAIKIADI